MKSEQICGCYVLLDNGAVGCQRDKGQQAISLQKNYTGFIACSSVVGDKDQ